MVILKKFFSLRACFFRLAWVGLCLSPFGLLAEVDFDRQIRPLLSDKCFQCHGPDQAERKGDLRFDDRESVLAPRDGYSIVVPGQADRSLLMARVLSEDPDERMPPIESKIDLSAQEIDLLRQWIEEGAVWTGHWAFEPIEQPALPVGDSGWGRNGIDAFIQRSLSRNGLSPNAPAERERLIRRVTMDLTGLPASLAEIDAFLADRESGAYERVVDRLLQSEAYAERMALDWMDVARYADSHGMHADGWRLMWPWRDWVIKAFRSNQPYDEFGTWQLAGDLLPESDKETVLATAFHRNHPMTAEGGVVDEEFRMAYVFDRVETTATAFLGLTMQCARCHDHKFDPIAQKDYYRMAAYFNNVRELGMTGDDGNYGPMLPLPSEKEATREATLRSSIASLEQQLQDKVQAHLAALSDEDWHLPPMPEPKIYLPFETLGKVGEGDKQVAAVDNLKNVRPRPGVTLEPGYQGQSLLLDSEYDYVEVSGVGLTEAHQPLSVGAWVKPSKGGKIQQIAGTSGQKNNFWRGWDFSLDAEGRLRVRFIHSLPHEYLEVRSQQSVAVGEWRHVQFTYDGSLKARGIDLYLDGERCEVEFVFDQLTQSILPVGNDVQRSLTSRSIRIGKSYRAFTGEYGIFEGLMDELHVFESPIASWHVEALAGRTPSVRAGRRMKGADARLMACASEASLKAMSDSLAEKRRALLELRSAVPQVMVMEEMETPRPTYVLFRGHYNQPREQVTPATPGALPAMPVKAKQDRLALAEWIFSETNPLTARVAVNRYWQMFFGQGLVKTTEDFGSQGSRPSHPELMDWLASGFSNSGWNLKRLVRLMVTSETYRQSSEVDAAVRKLDPANVWLGRAASHRWPGEFVRNNALMAAGLMSHRVGGPSVKPWQPEGLWIDKGNFSSVLLRYKPDEGEGGYRRSLYTFVRRTSPHPVMTIFDAPAREVCTVRRERTNTPLQALVMLNERQFFEAASGLAQRMEAAAVRSIEESITLGFRLATGRYPRENELSLLHRFYTEETARTGESVKAWRLLANTLLNFDEAYMKR